MMERINQRFISIQRVMLQTIKDSVTQMVPQLPNQQHQYISYP